MTEPVRPRMWDVVAFDDGDITRRGRVVGVSQHDGKLTVMGSNNQGFQVDSDDVTVEARPA